MGGCSAACKIAGGEWAGAKESLNGAGGGEYPNYLHRGNAPAHKLQLYRYPGPESRCHHSGFSVIIDCIGSIRIVQL